MKILFVVTEDWYFVSHRLVLAKAGLAAGYNVAVATRVSEHGAEIENAGIRVLPIGLRRSGRNPARELAAIWELARVFRREKPDILHLVAMKPVIYGALAAMTARPKAVIGALAGLGHAFTDHGLRTRLLRGVIGPLLRFCLRRRASWLILQNDFDAEFFVKAGLVRPERLAVIRGSGVDLSVFAPSPEPGGEIVATVVSRMLRDKGIIETVEAARELKRRGVRVRVRLVGDPDPENPSSLATATLRGWHDEGCVEWLGHRDDIARIWQDSHIALLPSYREGLPKSLIEAAASGRPLIATDVPGCRDVVKAGENGLLVPARDAMALADAIETLAAARELRARMGHASRERAEQLFSVDEVIAGTLGLYGRALDGAGATAGSTTAHAL